MATSSRNIAIGLVVAVVFVLIAFLLVSRTGVSKDKEVYAGFYREITGKMKTIDASFKPFGDALTNRQWVDAVKFAKNDLGGIIKKHAELENMKIPDLRDDRAKKKLEEAKELLTDAYRNKISVITNFLAFARDPKTAKEKDEEIKKNINSFNSKYKTGMERLLRAGEFVGADIGKLFQESQ